MLKDIVPAQHEITVNGGSFCVTGIAIEDLTILMVDFEEHINALITGKQGFMELVMACPPLVHNMIALAAGETDDKAMEAVKNLPIGDQGRALEAIWDLTLPDEEWLGKFLDRILSVLNSINQPQDSQSKPSVKQKKKNGKKKVAHQ